MIHFEPTRDFELIKSIMAHPEVYPWIGDDASPARENFVPVDHPGFHYVLAYDDKELLGLWLFAAVNAITWEVHTCLLPGHGFKRAREAARAMAEWVWANSTCRRIETNVPACNRLALKFAQDAGMEVFGIREKSYMKRGQVYDQTMLGLIKPEELCPQQ